MTALRGGDTVGTGYYWQPGQWDLVTIEREGAALPGSSETRYLRVPAGVLLLAAPILGFLFVIFLPFIGAALMLQRLWQAAVEAMSGAIETVLGTLASVRRPAVRFLGGAVRHHRTGKESDESRGAGRERGGRR